MSATITTPIRSMGIVRRPTTHGLSWHERVALGLGVVEIPLQIDKYFMFQELDAELGAVGGFNVSVTTACCIYLYAAWIMDPKANRRDKSTKLIWGVPMAVYILTVAFSVLVSAVPMLALFDLFLLMQAYALFFYFANRITTYSDLLFCFLAIAATMLFQSLIILGLASLGGSAAGKEFSFGPVLLSVWPDGRIAGSMGSAVVAGSLLAMLWLPVLSLNLTVRSWRMWSVSALALGLGFLALLLTQTRGAVLSVGIGTILIGASMISRNWLPKWAIGLAFGMALIGAFPLAMIFQKRVIGDDDGSAESRKHLSVSAMETISHRPIFGYGAGNCHLACRPVANSGKFRSEWYYTIHCKYLLVWIETGIVGLIAFLIMLLNGIRYGLTAWLSYDRLVSPLGFACAAAIFGHMVHMMVDIFNSRSQVQALWVIFGLSAAVYQQSKRSNSRKNTSRRGAMHVA